MATPKQPQRKPRKVVVWAVVWDDGSTFAFTARRDARTFSRSFSDSVRGRGRIVRCDGEIK